MLVLLLSCLLVMVFVLPELVLVQAHSVGVSGRFFIASSKTQSVKGKNWKNVQLK